MNKKKEIEELKVTVRRIQENFSRSVSWCSEEVSYVPKPQKVNTEKAAGVTLEELARYVLDGTPITRSQRTIVYQPPEPSTDGKAESK